MKNWIKNNMYAMSGAASWAWGISIVLGSQIIQQRGYIPFAIWATANSLALPLFALLWDKIKPLRTVLQHPVIRVAKTIIQVFCISIQITAIRQVGASTGLLPDIWGIIVPALYALVMMAMIGKFGMAQAVRQNVYQWELIIVGCIIGIIIGVTIGDISVLPAGGSVDDMTWAIYSVAILLSGPVMDHQHYERVEQLQRKGQLRQYRTAGILFAGYMALVAAFAHFQSGFAGQVVMFAITIGVTTSTLDSAISAIIGLLGKRHGLVIAPCIVAVWCFIPINSIMDLWTAMGSIRIVSVVIVLLTSVILRRRKT